MSASIYLFTYQYSNPSKRELLASTSNLPEFSDMKTNLQGFCFVTLKVIYFNAVSLQCTSLLSTGMLIGYDAMTCLNVFKMQII